MKYNKKRIFSCIAAIILIAAIICLAVYLKSVSDYKQSVANITFEEIDISQIPDGIYTGECNVNFISAKVEVTVKSGKIENINILEHKNDRGEPAEVIIHRIVANQKIDVDAVSGATNSSTVLKKAVADALAQ